MTLNYLASFEKEEHQLKVRTVWDSKVEKWYISIIDVIEVLTDITDVEQLFGQEYATLTDTITPRLDRYDNKGV